MAGYGYPTNLSYITKRLGNFSKNTYKLLPDSQNSASMNQTIQVSLPANTLVDGDTFTMYFELDVTGGAPRNIEGLIQRVEYEVNGMSLGTTQYWNQLFNTIADTSFGSDMTNQRAILQGSLGQNADGRYAIQTWLGFISSAKPQIIDTSLLGDVKIRITLAGSEVMDAGTFSLRDIYFSVTTCSINDGMFDAMHAQFLASGGVYELTYRNYLTFSNSAGATQSTKCSLSTQSLDRAWAIILPNPSGGAADPATANNGYFTRSGAAVSRWRFNVNNVMHPNWYASPEDAFALMMAAYHYNNDALGGCYTGLNTRGRWLNKYWCAHQEFCHGDKEFVAGVNTRGNTNIVTFDTDGSGAGTFLTLVFLQTTASLRIGAGRQLEVVM